MHAVAPPRQNPLKTALTAGFTLIELSIVLAVIALVVAWMLVGRPWYNNRQAQIYQMSIKAQQNPSGIAGERPHPGPRGRMPVGRPGSATGDTR